MSTPSEADSLSQFQFNFEANCVEVIDHLAHNGSIDLLVTKASKSIGLVHLVFSDKMCLFSGRYTGFTTLQSISRDDLIMFDDNSFKRLVHYANRIEYISLHLDENLQSKDEDMEDSDVQFWQGQAAAIDVTSKDMHFFREYKDLLLLVNKITSRTKLTLTTLREKLENPTRLNKPDPNKNMLGKTLKLLHFEEVHLPFAVSNTRMVSQLKHHVSVLAPETDGHTVGEISHRVDLHESAAAHSMASPLGKASPESTLGLTPMGGDSIAKAKRASMTPQSGTGEHRVSATPIAPLEDRFAAASLSEEGPALVNQVDDLANKNKKAAEVAKAQGAAAAAAGEQRG